MTDNQKFRNKYRISSARLKGYDYSQDGAYFVTICTKNRECHFGYIKNGQMQLSEIGKIACECWLQIPDHFPFVVLGEWVVMPNHVHGVVIIDKKYDIPSSQPYQNKFAPQSKNLASIIRGFKIGVTKNAHVIYPNFSWQPRFHDHIIRDKNELSHISEYIINNPKNWEQDENFKQENL